MTCDSASSAAAPRPSPSLAADNGGWQSLFDGKSSSGWVEVTGKPFPPNSWTIEDGCLKTLVRPGGAQDIRTVDKYRSFDLEFDWKVLANGNSGVKYLLQHIDEWNNQLGRQARARGLEYQLADNQVPTPSNRTAPPRRSTRPSRRRRRPTPAVGAFNHSRIVVNGDHVEHWLNGVRVVSFDLTGPEAQKIFAGLRKKGEDASTPDPARDPHQPAESRHRGLVQEPQDPPPGMTHAHRFLALLAAVDTLRRHRLLHRRAMLPT